MNKDFDCECDCGECSVSTCVTTDDTTVNSTECTTDNSSSSSESCDTNDSSSDSEQCVNNVTEQTECVTDDHKSSDSSDSSSEESKDCKKDKKQKKYRYRKHNKQFLNVCPPQAMFLDSNYVCLYEILYKGILDYNLEIQLANVLATPLLATYNSFYTLIQTVFKLNPLPTDGLRLVVTEPDGTVVIDTAMTTNNTFNNWKTKSINENHNTRVAIMDAQTLEGGVGFETKHSSTLDVNQYYVAIRGGMRYKNAGTFRLSIDVCSFNIE